MQPPSYVRYISFFFLLFLSLFCVGQERLVGEFTTKHIIWPHIIKLNGPIVETDEGSEAMIVKGGYLANAVLFYDSTNSLIPNNSIAASQGIMFAEQVGQDITLKGRTRWMLSEEDHIYGIVRRNDGTMAEKNAEGDGLIIITGGSGKLAGIRGKCSYSVKYLSLGYAENTERCRWFIKPD